MLKRFGRKEGLRSVIGPSLFYLGLSFTLGYSFWPYFYYVKNETLMTIGLFALWRYSWQLNHYVRAFIYHVFVYPRVRERIRKAELAGIFPDHVFFIIPSYNEEPWVSVETFFSIMSEVNRIPVEATIIVATGSEADDSVISRAYGAHPARDKVQLVLQRQHQGKRIAMGHSLRAMARRYHAEDLSDKNCVTIFMDGDSYLESGLLAKTLPLFCIDQKIGAVTTNELAYINTRSQWYKDWFNLKFGQRHILFQSHSLSRKVLTLTGRFSIFRTDIVVEEDFISQLENDILVHPIHGKFRFLMGDDKSSWFYLLKNRWDMLYIPDVICYSLESRDAKFLELSTSLPFRWYGNTMRNNSRSLALGWKKTGLFIWICILDQRLSMWTSLVGITGAMILAIFKDIVYLPIFIAWVLIVRTMQMLLIAFNGHPVSLLTIPIMLYNQWVGSIIKIRAFFHLSNQKWSKGKKVQDASSDSRPVPHRLAAILPKFLMISSYSGFLFALLVTENVIFLPDVHAIQGFANPFVSAKEEIVREKVIQAVAYGVRADDGEDDSEALNELIKTVPDGTVIQLPGGRIDLARPLLIQRSHVTLQGQSREGTTLYSQMRRPVQAVIFVQGAFGEKVGRLTTDAPIQSSVLESTGAAQLQPNDIVLLKLPNDEEFFDRIQSQRWRRKYPFVRQQMNLVTGVENGRYIYLNRVLDISYRAKRTMLIKPALVRDVTVRDLTVYQEIPGKDIATVKYRYENLYPDYMVDLIRFEWTGFCKVENLALLQAGRHPLVFENSYGNQAKNLFVSGAWNKGKKGNGYVRFARAYRCTFADSVVRDIRHITLQWSSAYNVLEHLKTAVDINLHGGYPHNNRIENITFDLPTLHKWKPITTTPHDARWAPPNGPGNQIPQGIETGQ